MPEITQCPQCQRKLNVPDAQIGQTVKCPLCGTQFTAAVLNIRRPPVAAPDRAPFSRDNDRTPLFDDDDDGDQPTRGLGRFRPHRGGAVFAVGLIGLLLSFCVLPGWILGSIAASMGATDMREMGRGRMDDSGRALTRGGQICGVIALVISTLTFLCFCLLNGRL